MSKISNPNALPQGTILRGAKAYRLAGVLGSGGFGITYNALASHQDGNITLSLTYAIKEFFPEAYCKRQGTDVVPLKSQFTLAKKDFVAEAARLRDLGTSNDNIVKVNEVFESGGTAYYVMEYIDGLSLNDLVRNEGRLSFDRASTLLAPVMDAVTFLHSRRINHLDIKPDNIMVRHSDNRPILIDFGQSRHFKENGGSTHTVEVKGATDGYAPIEQYAGIKEFSPKADVYALAATFCFALSGKNPPKADELKWATYLYVIRPLLPEDEMLDGCLEALRSGLSFSRDGRTASVAELKTGLGIAAPEDDVESGGRVTDVIGENRLLDWFRANWSKSLVAVLAFVLVLLLFRICGNRQPQPVPGGTQVQPMVDSTLVIVEDEGKDDMPDSEGQENLLGELFHVEDEGKDDMPDSEVKPEPSTPSTEPSKPNPGKPSVPNNQQIKNHDLDYALWKGRLKNGKPDGTGTMIFKKNYVIADRFQAQAGDYILDAIFNEGEIEFGVLYGKDGSEKCTILP